MRDYTSTIAHVPPLRPGSGVRALVGKPGAAVLYDNGAKFDANIV